MLQFGFRTGCSNEHPVAELMEEIGEGIDRGNFFMGLFIDIRKAFDTLDHGILISKLELYGIGGIALDWIRSYLKSRKQFVQLEDTKNQNLLTSCVEFHIRTNFIQFIYKRYKEHKQYFKIYNVCR